jgi:hypothetical protein
VEERRRRGTPPRSESLRHKFLELLPKLANLPKLSFDELAVRIRCGDHTVDKRVKYSVLNKHDRAKRDLVCLLTYVPPPPYLHIWSKIIWKIEKVHGHLRCPSRFLKQAISSLSELADLSTRTPPLF